MLTPPSDTPFYVREAEIIRSCGPTAAVVLDVLRHLTEPDGSGPSHQVVAQKLSIGKSTVQRATDKLIEAGVIKAEATYEDGHQITNRYSFPTTWAGGQNSQADDLRKLRKAQVGAHGQNDQAISNRTESDGEEHQDVEIGSSLPDTSLEISPQGSSGEGLRPSGVDAEPESGAEPQGVGSQGPFLPSRGTPMPEGKTRNLFDREIQASWLTVYFEGLVIDRDNRLRQAQGQKPRTTVGPHRQRKFLDAARCLLSRRDAPTLAEVKTVLDWLFTTWQGYLPFVENTDYPATDGKITRFWTIRNHYAELVAAMHSHQVPTSTLGKKPKAYYDHGEDSAVEDQVSVLVELFAKTRRRPPSDFDLFDWRKTFSIMLTQYQIRYDDIVMVVTALGDKRLHLDFGRYSAPYDLVGRPGEWENILDWVKIALLREQKMPTPPPSHQRHWDDDDYYPSPRPDSDAGGSVNMAASVEERRRRYEARQRPRPRPLRSPWDEEAEWA